MTANRSILQSLTISGLALLSMTAATNAHAAGPDLLNWSDCPPGLPYAFGNDPRPAHFQTSPVSGPFGGTCSLEVVSGSVFYPTANSAGGVAFATPGEVAGGTYTIGFDVQFVSGTHPWNFVNQTGDGVINGLSFGVNYPGDRCWHRVQFTGSLGSVGPKPYLFVYQSEYLTNVHPEEIRIDNMLLRENAGATPGLVIGPRMNCGSI